MDVATITKYFTNSLVKAPVKAGFIIKASRNIFAVLTVQDVHAKLLNNTYRIGLPQCEICLKLMSVFLLPIPTYDALKMNKS